VRGLDRVGRRPGISNAPEWTRLVKLADADITEGDAAGKKPWYLGCREPQRAIAELDPAIHPFKNPAKNDGCPGSTLTIAVAIARRGMTIQEDTIMPSSVKDMLAAANAAVPKIGVAEAQALIDKGNVLVVDVRDGTEVAATGKAAGALHVSRGLLEFKADPDSPSHDKAFSRDKTVLLYWGSGGRAALAGKLLQDFGYKDVRNLGGFKDWVEGGGKVEKT
jgi:rhodanese-related sulfurtransferase